MVAFIGLELSMVPPGLGPSEEKSIIESANVSFDKLPVNVVDLPYHIVQKFSLDFFGVSPLGVRLPSLTFGGLTAVLIALILRRWFKTNVAIVAALVVLSSSWFIGTLRLGEPAIMVPFWTSLILLAATYIAQETKNWKLWKVVLAFTAALSLYTPFMIYIFLAALLASVSQPHLRYLVKRSSKFAITVGSFFFVALLLPLGWGIYKSWEQIWQLLAFPQNIPGPMHFGLELVRAGSNLVNPYNVSFGEVLTPLLSLVSLALLIMGGIRLLRDSHSVRAHVLLFWSAILIPVVALNPNNLIVLLVPAMLVMAIGVHLVINYWYRLFPRNPYARVFGLVPLAILVATVVQFNYQRYVFGMTYSQQAVTVFNNDSFLAQKTLKKIEPGKSVTVIVPKGSETLYGLVAKAYPNTKVVSPAQSGVIAAGTWLVAEEALADLPALQTSLPTKLIVNDRKEDGLRFRIYEK